ncbi:type 2 lanthipeptide synthetase LanM family protein [Kyrpidia tusciae]|uniref:Lanthionine synthetase C family protein n=1 Tax=Kyrpidia tusciae (strain DSM 2912 / NBRC 15312 / T2) TaxID=562970 RepID=D5WV06_KYRT2|nr:type 2 lanthipeptide synthetase LanM family protein [Kyrpidia tusciae]ADG07478.1 Lanthionine synthetase C family protein [Kyrpidia tusciae DSM 2912]
MSVLMLSHVKPSWWWRACTLRERRDLLKGGLDAARPGCSRAGASETVLQEDGRGSQGRSVVGQDRAEDGKQRLERGSGQGLLEQWRKKALLLQDERFRQRLAADDLDEATMEALLHLANAEVCPLAGDVKEPEWVGVFREAMELAQEDDGKAVRCLGLDQAVRPFLLWALRAWERHFLPTPDDERIQWEPVIGSAIQTLGMELVQVAARTLVLELNVCRLREQLEGETPEERFQSFVRLLGRPEFLSAFYDEYAVLARLLTLRTKFYVNHVTELLDRYLRDVERLVRELGLDGSPLVELHSGVGDAHRQGRTVTRLRFGSGAQVVYKPRPLAGAVRVQRLLRWLGEKGFRPELGTVAILEGDGYGWEAFVEARPCPDEEAVRRFYRRTGALLAVAYCINGNDFHFENLIAAGESPILVDWETIFTQRPPYAFPDSADVRAKDQVAQSVLVTGLLPLLTFQGADGVGVELSGLGGKEQWLPHPVLQVEKEGTDEMRFVRKPKTIDPAVNRPWMERDGQRVVVEPGDYVDDIVAGFVEVCDLFARHRQELLGHGGALRSFARVPIRVLVRATHQYANLLIESYHPDYLRDALDRERLLDRIWAAPIDLRFIPAERDDMMEGDVPYFETVPESRDVWDSRGRRLAGVFPKTGMDAVVERLENLDPADVRRQAGWIRASLVAAGSDREEPAIGRGIPDPTPPPAFGIGELLGEAERMGWELVDTAIWGPRRRDCTWIGLGVNHRGQWNVSALDAGLYNGVAGVAFFLGYLSAVTGDETFRAAARAALETARGKTPFLTRFPSALFGLGSVLYAVSHLGPLLQFPGWEEDVRRMVGQLGQAVEADRSYDLLSGGAGVIHVLLNVHEQLGLQEALEVAVRYGDHLCRNRQQFDSGTAWVGEGHEGKGLAGMAHGTAGVVWALLRLAAATGDETYRRAAEEGLAYERSLYRPEAGNWLDLRHEGDAALRSVSWCHGAPGIGLSRAASLGWVSAEQRRGMVDELHAALRTTSAQGLGRSHCLCHGDLGNAELLLWAGRRLGNCALVEKARWIGAEAVKQMRDAGRYRHGVPMGLETVGLWLGSAGIGYQLMRLAVPARVPSVLLLEGASPRSGGCGAEGDEG